MSGARDGSPVTLPAAGDRARLRRRLERFPRFHVEAGATGTIREFSESLISLRMDEDVPGAEEWDNAICWTAEDSAPGLLIAVFFDDAEVFGNDPKERMIEEVVLAEVIRSSGDLTMSQLLAELNQDVTKGHARRTLEIERAVVELIVVDLVRRHGPQLVPTPAARRVGELGLF